MKVPQTIRLLFAAAWLLPLQAYAAPVPPPPAPGSIHLEAEGGFTADFARCGQIGTESQAVTMMSGGSVFTTVIPGKLRTGDVVCERTLTTDKGLWIWRHDVETGNATGRRDAVLTVAGTEGPDIVAWTLKKAWPRRLVFDASSGMEAIVFVADTLTRRGDAETPVIVWNPASLTYGTPLGDAQLNATTTAPGSFTYNPPAGTILGAGTRTLTATFTSSNPDAFTNATVTAQLTVNRAVITVRADNKSKVYGAAVPELTFTLSGFVNGESSSVITGTPSITTTAAETSPVGNYPITAAGTLSATNYSFTFVNGTLSVTPARLTVSANNLEILYGDPIPPLTVRYSGFVLGEGPAVLTGAPTVTTTATSSSLPGSYPIVVSAGTLAATNYSFEFFNGTLSILGARTMLRRAGTLTNTLIVSSLHPGDREKLEMIVRRLMAASEPVLWTDEVRPLRSSGQQVFADAKDAVVKLTDLLGGNKSSLDIAKLRNALDLVVRACRIIAVVAIDDAVRTGASASSIQKARADLAAGDADAAAKRYSNAVLSYRNAWADLK